MATTVVLQAVPAHAATDSGNTGSGSTGRTLTVTIYRQQYSNDCEAAALRMLIAFRGPLLSDSRILDQIHVDMAHPHAGFSGPKSGDPYTAFVGSPKGDEQADTGFGVYWPRIAAVASADGLHVLAAGPGIRPADLYRAVANGHPAEVWVDYLWRSKRATYYTAYNGRRVLYAGPAEHAVVVSGVTSRAVLINDPARGRSWVPKAQFEAGYSTYQDMAVIVR